MALLLHLPPPFQQIVVGAAVCVDGPFEIKCPKLLLADRSFIDPVLVLGVHILTLGGFLQEIAKLSPRVYLDPSFFDGCQYFAAASFGLRYAASTDPMVG